jgi:hypothetical protein
MKFQTLNNGKLAVRGNNKLILPGRTVQIMWLDGSYSVELGKCIQQNIPLANEVINICLVKSKNRISESVKPTNQ